MIIYFNCQWFSILRYELSSTPMGMKEFKFKIYFVER